MGKRMYFLRKKNTTSLVDKLIKQFELKTSFQNKRETILKNENFLVTLKKKYISILLYDVNNKTLADEINSIFT